MRLPGILTVLPAFLSLAPTLTLCVPTGEGSGSGSGLGSGGAINDFPPPNAAEPALIHDHFESLREEFNTKIEPIEQLLYDDLELAKRSRIINNYLSKKWMTANIVEIMDGRFVKEMPFLANKAEEAEKKALKILSDINDAKLEETVAAAKKVVDQQRLRGEETAEANGEELEAMQSKLAHVKQSAESVTKVVKKLVEWFPQTIRWFDWFTNLYRNRPWYALPFPATEYIRHYMNEDGHTFWWNYMEKASTWMHKKKSDCNNIEAKYDFYQVYTKNPRARALAYASEPIMIQYWVENSKVAAFWDVLNYGFKAINVEQDLVRWDTVKKEFYVSFRVPLQMRRRVWRLIQGEGKDRGNWFQSLIKKAFSFDAIQASRVKSMTHAQNLKAQKQPAGALVAPGIANEDVPLQEDEAKDSNVKTEVENTSE